MELGRGAEIRVGCRMPASAIDLAMPPSLAGALEGDGPDSKPAPRECHDQLNRYTLVDQLRDCIEIASSFRCRYIGILRYIVGQ